MNARIQHIALQVADVERSSAFYTQVFGGRAGTKAVPRSGPFIEKLLNGPAGIGQKNVHIALPQGGIELVEIFHGDAAGTVADRPLWQRRILHFCIQVDDVRATAARVEAAGGRLQFPVSEETGRPFVFAEDPDGHVIELLQMDFTEAIATVHRFVPGSQPD